MNGKWKTIREAKESNQDESAEKAKTMRLFMNFLIISLGEIWAAARVRFWEWFIYSGAQGGNISGKTCWVQTNRNPNVLRRWCLDQMELPHEVDPNKQY
jgi:hypothetical protein